MNDKLPNKPEPAEFLLYQTEDGQTRLEVAFRGETCWLSLNQLAELFQRDKSVISRHIKNFFDAGELMREETVAKFATVQPEGAKTVHRQIDFFNLDVIISVGYRVKSHRGTQFRIWATQRLREFIVKGFTMDDDRLKRAGGGNYFDELLARIRDIRSAEKVFWRKVLDIYATSIDYDPGTEASQRFFATVQNKMHWAAHGQTAAEVVYQRADAEKDNMGLTNWVGTRLSKSEAVIAKNYLMPEELDTLNRIVNAYLEFAELQALNRKPMYMEDWVAKLDDFLKLSGRELLTHAGKISHEQAIERAQIEYEKHRTLRINRPSPVEKHFEQAVKNLPKQGNGSRENEKRKKKKRERFSASRFRDG